jgi:predicted transcriptional regulator
MTRFGIIPATIFDADLTPQDIALLALLSTYADKTGYCWPSYDTLADKLNRSKGWVSQRMSVLEDEGFVEISKRAGNKYGFKVLYDSVQPTEQSVQPAKPNKTNNNKKYRYTKSQQIPDEFKPTPEMLEYLRKNRPDLDPYIFTRDFITRCKAKGYLYKRWDMAWQNWVNNEKATTQHGQSRSFGHRKGSPTLEEIGGSITNAIDLASRSKS